MSTYLPSAEATETSSPAIPRPRAEDERGRRPMERPRDWWWEARTFEDERDEPAPFLHERSAAA